MSPDSSRSLKLSNTPLHVLLPLYVAVLRFQFLDCSYSERCTTEKVVNTAFSAGSVPLASQMNTFTIFIDDVAFVVLVYTGGYVSDVWLQLNKLLCSKATSCWNRKNICEEFAENTSLFHICFTWRQKSHRGVGAFITLYSCGILGLECICDYRAIIDCANSLISIISP